MELKFAQQSHSLNFSDSCTFSLRPRIFISFSRFSVRRSHLPRARSSSAAGIPLAHALATEPSVPSQSSRPSAFSYSLPQRRQQRHSHSNLPQRGDGPAAAGGTGAVRTRYTRTRTPGNMSFGPFVPFKLKRTVHYTSRRFVSQHESTGALCQERERGRTHTPNKRCDGGKYERRLLKHRSRIPVTTGGTRERAELTRSPRPNLIDHKLYSRTRI